MKRFSFIPGIKRPTGRAHFKVLVCAAGVAIGLVYCLGAVFGQAQSSALAIPGSSTDISAWINQQTQAGQTSTQIGAGIGTPCWPQTDCSNPCPCQPQVVPTPVLVTNPCQPAGCDPLGDLCGKNVTVHLDNDLSVAGVVVMNCKGFLVLKVPGVQTLTVNIQKILYIESD